MQTSQDATSCPGGHGAQHGRDIVVVAIALVAEPPPVGEHADDAGLAALDDVREAADRAVGKGHQRHRAPGARRGERVVHPAAHGLAEAQAVAGGGGRGDGPVLLVGGEHGAAALGIVREAAGREHDAAPRPDFDLARPACASTAPRTAPPSCSSRTAGADVRRSTPRSAAERSSRPTRARPLRSCIPRRCRARSIRCRPKRRATWTKARGERVTFMNAREVRPGLDGHAHERRLAHRPRAAGGRGPRARARRRVRR